MWLCACCLRGRVCVRGCVCRYCIRFLFSPTRPGALRGRPPLETSSQLGGPGAPPRATYSRLQRLRRSLRLAIRAPPPTLVLRLCASSALAMPPAAAPADPRPWQPAPEPEPAVPGRHAFADDRRLRGGRQGAGAAIPELPEPEPEPPHGAARQIRRFRRAAVLECRLTRIRPRATRHATHARAPVRQQVHGNLRAARKGRAARPPPRVATVWMGVPGRNACC